MLADSLIPQLLVCCSDHAWFHEDWFSKIKQNVGSNKILKVQSFALSFWPEIQVDMTCLQVKFENSFLYRSVT